LIIKQLNKSVSTSETLPLTLYYARAQELGPWLDLVAVRGEGVVPFWLQPGEAAVSLGVGEEQREERIPEQLRRFL